MIKIFEGKKTMTGTWITKSARTSLKNAIKARLRISDARANAIIETNWLLLPIGPLRGCIVTVSPSTPYAAKASLSIYVPTSDPAACTVDAQGKPCAEYDYMGGFELEDEDIARWKALDLEEAYALPAGFVIASDTWIEATVLDAKIAEDETIDVTVHLDNGETVTYAKEAVINTLEGTLDYVRGCIGKRMRICLERNNGRTTICLMLDERRSYDLAA